jgi:hypothetical protein
MLTGGRKAKRKKEEKELKSYAIGTDKYYIFSTEKTPSFRYGECQLMDNYVKKSSSHARSCSFFV